MKILQINNYHYVKGGSDRVYLETSALLKEKGNDVLHFSVNDPNAIKSPSSKYFIAPVDNHEKDLFRRFGSAINFIYSSNSRKQLEQLIEIERPQVAHLHIFYGRLTSSILPVLRKYCIPVVMTVHEYRMLCPVYLMLNGHDEICEKCAAGAYIHCILGRCNRRKLSYSVLSALECYVRDHLFPYDRFIKTFIMVSRFSREKHLQYKPGLRNKCVHLYNPVDMATYQPIFRPGDYYLYLGRFSREKGLMTLLDAWRSFPDIRLKIAGDGALRKELATYIDAHGLKQVEMKDYLRGSELRSTIQNARCVVAPSEWYENNPMTIIEAFAYGKPVIASRIGGIPEIVEDGKTGYLFQSGNVQSLIDAVKRAEREHENYAIMAGHARAFAENTFGTERYYNALMDIYHEALR